MQCMHIISAHPPRRLPTTDSALHTFASGIVVLWSVDLVIQRQGHPPKLSSYSYDTRSSGPSMLIFGEFEGVTMRAGLLSFDPL